ncbi:MAG: damage-control phosphatase ARMT1 family protein [Candidatus Natronoplasma sp.]
MKSNLDCIPCFLRQALEASRMATDDEEVQREVLDEVMDILTDLKLESKKPPEIGKYVHRAVKEITDTQDPYREIKEEQNEEALKIYPKLEEKVKSADDRLLTAVKIAIAGNVIDLGPGHAIDLEADIEEVLSKELTIDHFDEFKKNIERSETIFYLGDNAGEIVFDKILLRELEGKEIFYFVKGAPKINDAMAIDAKKAGIDEYAKVDVVGNGRPGTGPERDSPEFIERMQEADMVISKGMGNYEALSEVPANIFFLLKAKCPVIADDLGVEVGDIILK